MLRCRGHGFRLPFNSTSSRIISLADWRADKLSTLKRCGRRSGSNRSFIQFCQLSATGTSTCHEIARAESKSGLHRRTILLSSLIGKSAGDIPIRRSYHELTNLSVSVASLRYEPLLGAQFEQPVALDSLPTPDANRSHTYLTGTINSIVPAPGFNSWRVTPINVAFRK